MNIDEIRPVLLWMTERLLIDPKEDYCGRCNHSGHYHRLDDSTNVSPTDPQAEFRCVFPMPDGPAVRLCVCPDHVGEHVTADSEEM